LPDRPRILIADDHTFVAESVEKLLETVFDVVGIVKDGHAMVRAAADLKPDVILIDVGMPVMNGLDAGGRVKEILPAIKLVYLTMNPDPELAVEAFRRGASGYLLKTCAASELVAVVRQALRGNSYLSPILKDNVNFLQWQQKSVVVDEGKRLTARQCEVLQLLAKGKRMKEIGILLKMTPRTVAFHKYRMMAVLGIDSNAELLRYALRNDIVAA
jgi:DNA-binding NarL/FixJ family response regulator